MLLTVVDVLSSIFLAVIVVLLFSLVVTNFAPTIKSTQQGFLTVLAYLAAELVALFVALWIVSGIAQYDLLPTLLAAGIAALIFVPGLAAKLPSPAAVTGLFKRN
ncbi:FtsH-binding integral membrane protein [Rhodopseudomonas rhenobacensis]|uniref:FtsH-binding integral membrane protein n=1 Tax=Rhodopseudomonas rhenobacensis TaxID=87461 RepID=A0A7W8DXG8_9BRAD|nr:hypothetical protein [Rhodopseudomonas rhenobacensis]MBB5045722.1 FtsH-binding integral membrane protein [Rhodopseudomonas rhenobacensis]